MPNGVREKCTRYVVRGTMDALSIIAVDCVVVENGFFVKVVGDCCRKLVLTKDAEKHLFKSFALAEERIEEIVSTGDFGDDPI